MQRRRPERVSAVNRAAAQDLQSADERTNTRRRTSLNAVTAKRDLNSSRTPRNAGDSSERAAENGDTSREKNTHGVVCAKQGLGEEASSGVNPSARASTLGELLETLKLLEEEPDTSPQPDKYAWIDKGESAIGSPTETAVPSNATLTNLMETLEQMEKNAQDITTALVSPLPAEVCEERYFSQIEQESAEVTSTLIKMKLELEEKRRSVHMLQTALAQQKELTVRYAKDADRERQLQLQQQKEHYETAIQRHLSFIDQLIEDKKNLSEKCESVVKELQHIDGKYARRLQHMQEQHEKEVKRLKDVMAATEKLRREKWIDEKTKKIKEITVKGLEPEIQKLISKHKQELARLSALHDAELQASDERAAKRYVQQIQELRAQLDKEKEAACQRERDVAQKHYEQALMEEQKALHQQRLRIAAELSQEKERLSEQAHRQRADLEELRRQLERNSITACQALKEEYHHAKEEQEKRHQVELLGYKERLEIEKQTWEENYRKKQEAWLLSRERELREEVRKTRDEEIEMVIRRLEDDATATRQECDRAAENRLRRVREMQEAEVRELEQAEKRAQAKAVELRTRLTQVEGEAARCQGLLQQKDAELSEMNKVNSQLMEERNRLGAVLRQEFAERLAMTEEENRHLQAEMTELRARQHAEIQRVHQDKEKELQEVHQRVKAAIVKKEEMVNSLRKQHEASVKRAEHLEGLLEQQRKQLLGK
uniref:Centrosomal protein of 131 kDa-like isoform X1 n=2 Tax=Petromyzon marinus TaxID=7757 RepID=A0AAJ7THY0_PETMA|nr:centrosomal protein of 131 kDa-like isoform X1 [Petromyzon marinus]